MSPTQVRAEYHRMFKAEPPNVGPSLLSLAIAYRLQEKARGGLSSEHARQVSHIASQLARDGTVSVDAAAELKAGSRLVRHWRGVPHQVLIRDDGYAYGDRIYQSLTQIARDITGTNWSGPRFFGLNGKGTNGGYGRDYAIALTRVSYLAPSIVKSILGGVQPKTLSATPLVRTPRLPYRWEQQCCLFGAA